MKIDLTQGPREFLKARDLDGDTRARIVKVELKEIQDRFHSEPVARMIGSFELINDPTPIRTLIMNKTIQIQIAKALDDDETDHWVDREIILYETLAANGKEAVRAKALPKEEA
ncbi:MAG: hypothetical protein E4H00_05455 [Myxococcales bacterium]|nr:MAG: hypothetical protein E4H00_05455 [Myxococcales bacterium]